MRMTRLAIADLPTPRVEQVALSIRQADCCPAAQPGVDAEVATGRQQGGVNTSLCTGHPLNVTGGYASTTWRHLTRSPRSARRYRFSRSECKQRRPRQWFGAAFYTAPLDR